MLSLEEAGEALFAFTHLPANKWKSARTTNAIERLHEMGYPGQEVCGGFFAAAA